MVEASFCNKNVISSNCPNGPEEFFQMEIMDIYLKIITKKIW